MLATMDGVPLTYSQKPDVKTVLTVRPKISEFAFRVFGRSLHPELFDIYTTRTITRDRYELRVDITSAGHVLTWKGNQILLSEVACSHHQPLPQNRQLIEHSIQGPCAQQLNVSESVDYWCNFQLDPADPKTFAMIQKELLKSTPCEGLIFQFQASGRMAFGAISYVNIQSRQNTVHIRAFHTFPDAYIVMKSESMFTIRSAG